jgi:hypothetical protein
LLASDDDDDEVDKKLLFEVVEIILGEDIVVDVDNDDAKVGGAFRNRFCPNTNEPSLKGNFLIASTPVPYFSRIDADDAGPCLKSRDVKDKLFDLLMGRLFTSGVMLSDFSLIFTSS